MFSGYVVKYYQDNLFVQGDLSRIIYEYINEDLCR